MMIFPAYYIHSLLRDQIRQFPMEEEVRVTRGHHDASNNTIGGGMGLLLLWLKVK